MYLLRRRHAAGDDVGRQHVLAVDGVVAGVVARDGRPCAWSHVSERGCGHTHEVRQQINNDAWQLGSTADLTLWLAGGMLTADLLLMYMTWSPASPLTPQHLSCQLSREQRLVGYAQGHLADPRTGKR